MTGAFRVEIGELVVPGTGPADGRTIAESTHQALSRLYREDQAAGVAWREALPAVDLEVDPKLPLAKVGEAIARTIRARLVEPEQAR